MKMKSPLLLSAAVAAAVAVVPHAVYSHQQQSNSISNNDNEHERHSRRRGPLDVSSPAEAADSDSVPAQRPSLRTLRIRPESQVEVAAEVPATAIVAAVLANVTRAEHNVTRAESEPEEEPEYFFAVESKSGKSNKSGKSSSSSSAEYIEYYEDLEPGTYILPAHPKVKSGKSAPGLLFDENSEPDTHTILPASAAFPKSGKSAPQLGVYYENSVPKAGKVSGSKSIKTTTTTTSDGHHYYGGESAAFPKSGKAYGSKSSNGYQYYGSESAAFPKSGKAYGSKSSNGYQYYGSESAAFPKSGKTSGSDSKSGKAYSGKSSKVEYYGANKYTTGDIITSSPTPDSMNKNPTIKAQSETPTKSPIKQPLMLRSEDDINEYACTGKPCAITTWCRSRYGTCGPGRIYCGSYSAWESSCPPVTDSPTTSPSEEPTPFEEGVSANFNSQSLLDPLGENEAALLNDSEEGALLNDLELGTEDTTSKRIGTGTGIDSPEGISASAIMIMGILFCVAVMATGLYYGKKKDEEEMHRALNSR